MKRIVSVGSRVQLLALIVIGGAVVNAGDSWAGEPPRGFQLGAPTPICAQGEPVVRLSWSGSTGASSYEIVRDGGVVGTTGGDGRSFDCKGLRPGLTYNFAIRAVNDAGTRQSGWASASMPNHLCPAKLPPGAPKLGAAGPGCDQASTIRSGLRVSIQLGWTAAEDATEYDVIRNGQPVRTGLKEVTYHDSGELHDGQTYVYLVRARNSQGVADSKTVTVVVPERLCEAK